MPVMEVEKERRSDLQVLCHKHHVKLEPTSLGRGNQGAGTIVYACRRPTCPVHYNSAQGYFVRSDNGDTTLTDFAASVLCLNDGMSMYLAKVLPDKKSFRLWKCPACNTIVAMNA
jgi:hypothetical protein